MHAMASTVIKKQSLCHNIVGILDRHCIQYLTEIRLLNVNVLSYNFVVL